MRHSEVVKAKIGQLKGLKRGLYFFPAALLASGVINTGWKLFAEGLSWQGLQQDQSTLFVGIAGMTAIIVAAGVATVLDGLILSAEIQLDRAEIDEQGHL